MVFKKNGVPMNGLNPKLLNGNASILGNSFDPEGLVVLENGNFIVADKYGPSVFPFIPLTHVQRLGWNDMKSA
ncbi:MAG: hypothetical protein DDT26_02717 [Dehalococcoidia bacterium]|nr:hypothetical protein [Chloroflexota bacterium]